MPRWMSLLVTLVVVAAVEVGGAARAGAAFTAGDGGNTINVGVSTSSSTPGSPGSPGGPGSYGGSVSACSYIALPPSFVQGLGPGGPLPGGWYVDTCAHGGLTFRGVGVVWITYSHPGPPPGPAVPPSQLASEAASSLALPVPAIHLDPAAFSVVNLRTWLWVDSSIWHPYSTSASAGGESVSATATPVSVTWQMGDGGTVTCAGPGTPYDPALPAASQQSACSYTYRVSSAGRASPSGNANGAAFEVTATVDWQVTWVGGGTSGTLPSLSTSSSRPVRVEQIESVESAGP